LRYPFRLALASLLSLLNSTGICSTITHSWSHCVDSPATKCLQFNIHWRTRHGTRRDGDVWW